VRKLNTVKVNNVLVNTMTVKNLNGVPGATWWKSLRTLTARVDSLEVRVRRFAYREATDRKQIGALTAAVNTLSTQTAVVDTTIAQLNTSVSELGQSYQYLLTVFSSGLYPNPALEAQFTQSLNQSVTVVTPAGSITGTVIAVGTDAVELREANNDVVIIPYHQITAVV
jgi:ribosome maturation factor RimP